MIKKTKLSPSKKLSKIRKNIDKIDIKILHLLKQRRKQVIQIVKVKPKRKIVDKIRIKKMLFVRCNKAKNIGLETFIVKNIWMAMIKSFIKLQRKIYK